ncbi:MAG: Hsp20/alpha crystallin family protein, partial [Gemmatimonadaceae bacterium]
MISNKLTRSSPYRSLARELDDFVRGRFGRFFGDGFDIDTPGETIGWSPAVDVVETEKSIKLTAELPGLAKDNVNVSVDSGVLAIRGEKKSERKEDDKDERYHLWERSYGAFERAFTLPTTVDPDKITADFKDGVLVVDIPKSTEAKPRGRAVPIG